MADPVRDFLQDANGNLAIINGDFALVAGEAACEQALGIRQRMIEGECMLDGSLGLPLFTYILQKGADPVVVKELLLQRAMSVPDVISVVVSDVAIDPATRVATITEAVKTVYSTDDADGSPLQFQIGAP